MLRFLVLLVVTLATSSALAGTTPWQELAPGARARLVSADTSINGQALAAIEIDLQPGVNTYWRVPGETGIPTSVDFAGSKGLSSPAVVWPYPEIDQSAGYRDYVYRDHIVLPIRFSANGDHATLGVEVALGICADVCVPASATFALPISFGKPDGAQQTRINLALRQTPLVWDRSDKPFAWVAATSKGLVISAPNAAIDPQSLIADVGDAAVLLGAPKATGDGSGWTVPLLSGGTGSALVGKEVELTFNLLGSFMGPYSATAIVVAGAP